MHNLKSMPLEKIPPTVGLNIARLDKKGGEYVFWDVGGQSVLRKIWNKYFSECNGLVFVIDGADEIRFQEVKETLEDVFTEENDTIGRVPVLFLLNKNDKGEFRGVDFISETLSLNQLPVLESVVLPVSALDKTGLETALNWILTSVKDNK